MGVNTEAIDIPDDDKVFWELMNDKFNYDDIVDKDKLKDLAKKLVESELLESGFHPSDLKKVLGD
jgi:hypothetical protein